MKLNYKKTICVGFAFFLISMFWQAYDTLVPKILTDKFGMAQTWSGAIMAMDNLIALFLLPIFGAVSDKTKTRFGRRTPYIVVGTVISSVAFFALSFIDNWQRANLGDLAYDTPDRLTKAWEATVASPVTLVFFIVMLLVVLLAMAIFRSPAVALMPDVTVKPLRSKANAIINLMGTAGGIIVLALGIVFGTGKPENALMSYTVFFGVVGGLMLLALVAFLFTVNEPKLVREMEEESARLGLDNEDEPVADANVGAKLDRPHLVSLLLILASVALWYMGYNAVTTKYSVYAGNVLGLDYNTTLIIAQGAAIVAYIPAGIVATKLGRRKTILGGVIMLFAAFFFAAFLRAGSPALLVNLLFILAGIAWATINVNSFPMVVELSKSADVGRYTGFYYTASMSAQIVTPILSGVFLDHIGMTTLFPYAAIFVALAFVTMFFVRHGDAKPTEKKSVLEQLGADD